MLFNSWQPDDILGSSRVSQGSHLGSILFILHINDLLLVIESARISMSADDVELFLIVNSEIQLCLLQADVNNFVTSGVPSISYG